MPRRSISNREIGLIKAMLLRGMKNRDIQFYFNRQDRPVNSGRITQIRNGSYGPEAATATETELDAFLTSFKPAEIGAVIQSSIAAVERTKAESVKALFRREADGSWKLVDGETDQHECKKDFDLKKLSPILRAIAALSNNRGGFLLLGVSNEGCRAEGVGAAFDDFDVAKLIDKAKVHLSPTPRITTKGSIDLDGTTIGFIHVEPHPDKPVIVCRDDGDKLKEGEILFRYAGQSARIKFGDLRDMLAERDRRAQIALATAAGKLATVGTSKALILDTERNVLDAEGREILIDEELAKNLNFIREGRFDEIDGDPTLKLVGEVKSVDLKALGTDKIVPKAISQEDILTAFLAQRKVTQPSEFVIAGVSQPRFWLPIFFFTKQAGLTSKQMIDEIETITTSQKGKKKNLIDRLSGKRSAFTKVITQKARAIANQIEKGTLEVPEDAKNVAIFSQAITGTKTTSAKLSHILKVLQECRKLAITQDDANALGAVFKAACRIDEMFFAT